jgi:acetylornithine deacetylase/succinyl-diaminopimelate desuccinylase-like protein
VFKRLVPNLQIAVFGLTLFLPTLLLAQNSRFDADSAYSYLKHLTVTIGPRPMGSANEQKALLWATDKFRSFGADTAYVMAISEATVRNRAVNTNSGVAVGIFRGETDSTIVVGGHIDSSELEVPGANDDGSGTASVIELSRIWSQRPRHYTLLFAAFGGEERGLIGSKYFVDHYPEINKIVLMLQIDMSGSEGWLIPFFDLKSHQAPIWLVEDAYTADRALGYNSLRYPTHFF